MLTTIILIALAGFGISCGLVLLAIALAVLYWTLKMLSKAVRGMFGLLN